MSLPRIALFSDSEYAALRVGVLREGKERFHKNYHCKNCNGVCGCLP